MRRWVWCGWSAAGIALVALFHEKHEWRNLLYGVAAAALSPIMAYWHDAPHFVRRLAYCIGPLFLLEAVTAVVAQWAVNTMHVEDDEQPIALYHDDHWMRAFFRLGAVLAMTVLAASFDTICELPYSTVICVLGWGFAGHGRASLRHLSIAAATRHMELPMMPADAHETHHSRRRHGD